MAPRYHTVPLLPDTWERLRDYRLGGATYDDVVRRLLDQVPLEAWMAEHAAGHERHPARDAPEPRRDLGLA